MHLSLAKSSNIQPDADGLAALRLVVQRVFIQELRDSLQVKSHLQLTNWLQGEFQRIVPHQVFIAAWGEFPQEAVQNDAVAEIADLDTSPMLYKDTTLFVSDLFHWWKRHGKNPFVIHCENFSEGIGRDRDEDLGTYNSIRTVLVHGIQDLRNQQDCIYIFMNTDPRFNPETLEHLLMMVPLVDGAMRKIEDLPCKKVMNLVALEMDDTNAQSSSSARQVAMSDRQRDIMHWVSLGKSNYEVGLIMNISPFTVKNHLHRIFQILNVANRAQAVSKIGLGSSTRKDVPSFLLYREELPRAAVYS